MTKDYYVSYETAKLLKEKGFECERDYITAMYNELGEFHFLSTSAEYYYDYEDFDDKDCVAATLSMAMNWLRDECHIHINVDYIDYLEHGEVWAASAVDKKTFKEIKIENTENSYELAAEYAIDYILKNFVP